MKKQKIKMLLRVSKARVIRPNAGLQTLFSLSGLWSCDRKICNDIFGITRRRLRIIFLLMEYPNISVSELAALAELDLTQTSRTISSMMREGYLKRLSNPDNARYSILKLTEKSVEIYKDLLQQYQYVNNQLIDNFNDSELQQLDHLLKNYGTMLSR